MKTNKNQVRIIAGAWRGRFVIFPALVDLRPTSNRVRETLFNWLGSSISGMTCLDLFAGSGALGFEAASRGAGEVVLVDRNSSVCKSLNISADRLCARQVEIHRSEALDFCTSDTRRFDLVFLDPPFEMDFHDKIWSGIENKLKPGSLLYFESNRQEELPGCYTKQRKSKAGNVIYTLLEYRP